MRLFTRYAEQDRREFRRIVRRSREGHWDLLVEGEWSESPYHEGNIRFVIRCSRDRRDWALMEVAFPKRIIAAAETTGDEETECVAAYMMRASKTAGGSYFAGLAHDWGDVDPEKFEHYFVESRDYVAADGPTSH